MKSEFLISGIETGKLNAIVKNIMTQTGITEPEEAVRMMNSGELKISVLRPKWTEKDGIIYFSVTSNGTTGEEWIARLESKAGYLAKSVLRSADFKPTSGITYEIAVLKGEIFSDNDRITKVIRYEAENRKFSTPNAEVACLIRKKFTDKELDAMGFYWLVTMHEPIDNSYGDPSLLSAGYLGDGSSAFGSFDHRNGYGRRVGFAFVQSHS